jgi:carbonic anhydrase
MAIKIKGFDQITAWIGGIALSALIFTGVWYGGKWIANHKLDADEERVAAAQKDLKNLAKTQSPENAHHETSESMSESEGPQKNGSAHSSVGEPLERWGYTGNLAPWYWTNLNTKWAACGAKTGQSPIDISGAKLDAGLKSLKFYYNHGITRMTLLHETIQGEVDQGSYMEWDGERYDLRRVMFRTPSEHRVNGLPWEMEIQLEHIAVTGKIIFLSFLVTPGKPSEFINYLTSDLPRMEGEVKDIERVNWADLLPAKRTYWTYTGSTTTPPCVPDTKWVIFTDQVTTTKKSIDKLVLLQKSNVRPVYSLGKRALGRSNR